LAGGGGAALAAGSAPARTGSHMIVCPLEPSVTITTPCCGPPIVTAASAAVIYPCCGTPQPINCPVALTASASPNPSIAGQKVTISGRWPGNTAGQTVDLWQELPGAKTFTEVAHATTGSLGEYQFVRKGLKTNRKWYVSVGSEQSGKVDQKVVAVVTLESGGGANGYRGRVTPNHAGERVWVERQSGASWVVIARPRLSSRSTYSFTRNLCNTTSRVVFPGDRRNVQSPSDTMRQSCASFSGST
jgi:hypothetical protein